MFHRTDVPKQRLIGAGSQAVSKGMDTAVVSRVGVSAAAVSSPTTAALSVMHTVPEAHSTVHR